MVDLVTWLIMLTLYVYPLPIKDRRSRRLAFPWMTLSLVLVNTLIHIYVYEIVSASQEETYILLLPYMEIPRLILHGEGLGALSVLTSGFLHGGWWHLASNMFFLWFFGRKVEDATGPVRFVLFYLFCLTTSSFLSVFSRSFLTLFTYDDMIPALGASGAIFGVMAAYLFLYGDQRILTLILPIPWPFWIPAWIYIARELLVNALLGELVQAGEIFVMVGVFAHLGGALGGLLFIYLFMHPEVFAGRR
jgi:membrane associated rhomboid family serine protease